MDTIEQIGWYRIGKALGKGSFASVYHATHGLTEEQVAIKIIDKSAITDDYLLKNLEREARIMKKLDHPCIIQVGGPFVPDGV
jgi:serine/threonine protein kinase